MIHDSPTNKLLRLKKTIVYIAPRIKLSLFTWLRSTLRIRDGQHSDIVLRPLGRLLPRSALSRRPSRAEVVTLIVYRRHTARRAFRQFRSTLIGTHFQNSSMWSLSPRSLQQAPEQRRTHDGRNDLVLGLVEPLAAGVDPTRGND